MTIVLAGGGWVAALCAAVVALAAWRARLAAAESAARACHELRGPLTASRLGVQLGMRTATVSPSTLRAIDLELARAALALDDLAPGRRMRHGRPRLAAGWDEVDLASLLEDCAEAARGRAAAVGATVAVRLPESLGAVRGDRLRLAQAIGNLIANAVEHGGGEIDVCARRDGGVVRVEVTDGGRGLPAPISELMCGACGGRGERGRGLAIVMAIADAHGGRLGAAPSQRGARLVLELPRLAA